MNYELGLKFEAASAEEAELIAEFLLVSVVSNIKASLNVYKANSDLEVDIPDIYQRLKVLEE